MVARSASGRPASPCPKYSTNFPTTPVLRRICGHGEDEVGRRRAFGQLAHELEADDLRDEHRDRLAEHGRLGLDPADSPAEHAEPVDHRRVRVGAEQRVRERGAVPLVDDARQELEVDLVDDPGRGWDDLEVHEAALAPAQEGVALAVPLELELRVPPNRERASRTRPPGRSGRSRARTGSCGLILPASPPRSLIAFRMDGEVDDRGDAGEVLVQDAARSEGDRLRRIGGGHPTRDRLDVGGGDGRAVLVAEDVLEQDPERVGQAQARRTAPGARRGGRPRPRARRPRAGSALRSCPDGPSLPIQAASSGPAARRRAPRASSRSGTKCRTTASAYGRPDATGVGAEALVPDGREILGVRIEQMLASDLARGVEEREPHPERDLEQALVLALAPPACSASYTAASSAGLGRLPASARRSASDCFRALDLERREVDEPCRRPARALAAPRGGRRPTRAPRRAR